MNRFLNRLGWSLVIVNLGLVCVLAMAFFGQSIRQSGRVELRLIRSQADHYFYEGRLRSDSSVFRPNDLFAVESPAIRFEPKALASTSEWIPEDKKGRVQIESTIKLDEPPQAEFSLRIRWTKLIQAIALILMLNGSFLHWQAQYRNGIVNRIEGSQELTTSSQHPTRETIGSGHKRVLFAVSHSVLIALLAYYLQHILWPVGWIYGDSHYVLTTIVKGAFTAGAYFGEVGRFFPCAFLDLNLLLPFGNNPLAYQIERSVLFSVGIGVFYGLLACRCQAWVAAILLTCYLTTPELLRIFCDVIFPETLLSMVLIVFFSSYYRASQSQKRTHGLLAMLSAVLATYCKEPVFGALIVFSGSQLLMGYRQLSRLSIAINGFLLLNGIVFMALYYYFCSQGQNYVDIQAGGEWISPISVLVKFLSRPLIAAMLCLTGYRLMQVLFWKDRRYVFEDSVLLTGTSYVFAFALLRLSADYYLIPAYTCWVCALPGYFSCSPRLPTIVGSEACAESTSQIPPLRKYSRQLGLFGLMIIACLSLSNVIKGGEVVRESRLGTDIAERTIHELVNLGYEIDVYLPSGMSPRDRLVQSWRQLFLNTFYNSSLEDSNNYEIRKDPCRLLSPSGESGVKPAGNNKYLVIHDSTYDIQELNQSRGSESTLCRVVDFPLLHGAHVFVPREFLVEVNSILRKYKSWQ